MAVAMAHSDPRIATAGKKILSVQLPDQIRTMAREGYRYLGLQYVLADGNGTAALSVNAGISLGRPQTEHNVQVTTSNVGTPS
jgi:hypothetical protein